MGSVGDAYDNAMCESFFATLECELLARCRFRTQAEARNEVFAFIEGFYNPGAAATPRSDISHRSTTNGDITQAAVDPGPSQPAAVLAAVKDKPFGRPQEAVAFGDP